MILKFDEFINESRFEKNEAVLGDIFYETWGYDQTSQTFYQVVKTTPKGCVVKEIKYEIVGNKSGYNLVSPLKDQFVGNDILTKYVYYGSSLGLSNSKLQNTLYLWDNSPLQSDTSYR